jgi:hypothetical protein
MVRPDLSNDVLDHPDQVGIGMNLRIGKVGDDELGGHGGGGGWYIATPRRLRIRTGAITFRPLMWGPDWSQSRPLEQWKVPA